MTETTTITETETHKASDRKVCELFDPKSKKFINFKGVHRPMGMMPKEEREQVLERWFSFLEEFSLWCWNRRLV